MKLYLIAQKTSKKFKVTDFNDGGKETPKDEYSDVKEDKKGNTVDGNPIEFDIVENYDGLGHIQVEFIRQGGPVKWEIHKRNIQPNQDPYTEYVPG